MLGLKMLMVFLFTWSSLELFWYLKQKIYPRPFGLLWAAALAGLVAVFLL